MENHNYKLTQKTIGGSSFTTVIQEEYLMFPNIVKKEEHGYGNGNIMVDGTKDGDSSLLVVFGDSFKVLMVWSWMSMVDKNIMALTLFNGHCTEELTNNLDYSDMDTILEFKTEIVEKF